MSVQSLILSGLAIAVLSGCTIAFPKTAALEDVHRAYREEFATNFQKVLVRESCNEDEKRDDGFTKTRAEIDAFRSKYGKDGAVAAHLTVLEGMIYLQMNQFGLAGAYQDEVAAAGRKLTSGTGNKTRDALFAASYGSLVSGWKATCESSGSQVTSRDLATKLASSADEIEKQLNIYKDGSKLAPIEVDQGALYLMATALRFRQNQVAKTRQSVCYRKTPEECKAKSFSAAKNDLFHSVCQMQSFLTEDETSGLATEKLDLGSLTGRLRFAEIYRTARAEVGPRDCSGAN